MALPPDVTPSVSRRDLMQRAAAVGILATPAAGLLSACATSGGDDGEKAEQGEKTKDNPFGVKKDAPLDVVIFKGGFSDEYAKYHESLYSKKFPDAEIKHTGTQKIKETMQPRFNASNPPDFLNNSGAQSIPMDALVADNQLMDLAELMDAPSIDDPNKKVRDTLIAGTVEQGLFGDKMFVLNYAFTVYGIWYSSTMFEKNGWTYPKTWDEMLALCPTIQKAGVAPWTYQGKHPGYISWPILDTAVKIAGKDLALAIDNLEPNAWKNPAVLQAFTMYHELAAKGYIMKGTQALSHTEAQTAWNQYKAAFIPCATWLENEQRQQTPPDFKMVMGAVPSASASDKLPFGALRANPSEPYVIPAKAKNPYGGLEYMRIMLSKQGAKKFSELVSSLTVVDGAAEGLTGSGVASAREAFKQAGENYFTFKYATWYTKLNKEAVEPAIGEMMSNRLKPEACIDRIQKMADTVAKDDTIKKYKREK